MIKPPKISFVGSGNLATHLAVSLFEKGATILEVYSRNQQNASNLGQMVQASAKTDLDFSQSDADFILICTPDNVIAQMVQNIVRQPSITLVHTSGTTPLDTLKDSSQYGVLYPLQTFSKSHPVSPEGVPIFVEGNNVDTEDKIKQLASLLSNDVRAMNSEDRQFLHLAAVFANNFMNHLLTISEALLGHIDLDLETIKPLVRETVNKAYALGPLAAQTGPAKRADILVSADHERLLQEHLPTAWKIYHEHSKALARIHS